MIAAMSEFPSDSLGDPLDADALARAIRAIADCSGVQVVVHIHASGSPPRLTQLQLDVLEAAPSRLHHPVSVKKLAALSGYSYSGYFRNEVARLVEAGLLVRLPSGVRKAT